VLVKPLANSGLICHILKFGCQSEASSSTPRKWKGLKNGWHGRINLGQLPTAFTSIPAIQNIGLFSFLSSGRGNK
jgi:hypothetical protein